MTRTEGRLFSSLAHLKFLEKIGVSGGVCVERRKTEEEDGEKGRSR